MAKSIIVILGPTASGKSALAVHLARKFNGEVISADSRQVYKGMNLGSGKITKKEMKGVPHHLIDVASPQKRFDVTRYRRMAQASISQVIKRERTPMICGGTGFYIQAIIDGIVIPEVKPDQKLRAELEKLDTKSLFEKLKKLDQRRAKNIDQSNRRRLIRALEIVIKTGKAVPILKKQPLPYPVLMIGIKKTPEELKKLIKLRLNKRLNAGMVKEVKKLRQSGISWKKLVDFGLEYRFVALYLQGLINRKKMIELIQKESEHFTKRQMTWFKRDERIYWIKKQSEAEKLIKDFLAKQKGRD